MDSYERMYWELYNKIGQVIEELEAVRADTERLFLQEALNEEKQSACQTEKPIK